MRDIESSLIGEYNVLDSPSMEAQKDTTKFDDFMPDDSFDKEHKIDENRQKQIVDYYHSLDIFEKILTSFIFIFLWAIGNNTFLCLMVWSFHFNYYMLFFTAASWLLFLHILNVAVGICIKIIIPEYWIAVATIVAFIIIGWALIYFGLTEEEEEYINKKIKILKSQMSQLSEKLLHEKKGTPEDLEERETTHTSHKNKSKIRQLMSKYRVIMLVEMMFFSSIFSLSQFCTIILSTRYEYWTVLVGGAVSQLAIIFLAMCLHSLMTRRLSIPILNIAGGLVVLLFCISQIYAFLNE
jgi:putative Ca2+/H+ antiporter (TMEM165/GDT1 family)